MANITRRGLFKTFTAGAGMILAGSGAEGAQKEKKISGNPPFLKQWSQPPDYKKDLTPGKTKIRLASMSSKTTLDYPKNVSITDMVRRIRDAGYTAGNADCGEKYSRNPWLTASESEILELKEALKKYDVEFFEIQASTNNIHPDPEIRKKEQKWSIEQLEAAERVGCPIFTMHVGSMAPKAVAPHPANWTWECWNLGVKVMKQMVKDTEGMKACFGIEPDANVQINCNEAFRQLIDECGPRVKVTYDPVNMVNFDNIFRYSEFLNESFDILGEDIALCHAKDITIKDDLQPIFVQIENGKGYLDYETYLVRMSHLKYPRGLLLEHLSDDRYPFADKFVRETAAKVGVEFY